MVANGGTRDPGLVYFKLKSRLTIEKVRRQLKRQAEGNEGDHKGEPLDDAALPRKQCHDHGTGTGHEGRIRQYRIVQQDRRSLLEVHGKAEIRNQQQCGCANREPPCIGADVSRLHPLDQRSQAAHTARSHTTAAIDQSAIKGPP